MAAMAQAQPAPAFAMTQGQYQETVSNVLRVAFGRQRHAVKQLARTAGTSASTAKNWLEGRSTPIGLHMLRLMATVPELQAEVRRLTAMEADLDPEFDREFHQLVASYTRMKAGRGAP